MSFFPFSRAIDLLFQITQGIQYLNDAKKMWRTEYCSAVYLLFFAISCNKDSWYVGHDTWLACQWSRVRFREETFFLARKNLRNLRTFTSESILDEILAPMKLLNFLNNFSLILGWQKGYQEPKKAYTYLKMI